jgi:hypothetical protein
MKRSGWICILASSEIRRASSVAAVGLASLVALVFSAALAVAADREIYEEKFLKTEPLAANGKVYLSNISGNIQILTWNRNEVKIDAVKRSTAASLQKAKDNADMVKIEVGREDGRVNIETKYPEGRAAGRKLDVSVDYTLTVPAAASVTGETVSGDVRAAGMGGLAKLTTVSGNIEAAKMKNDGVFTTISGNIALEEIVGDVEANDISGSISLAQLSGTVKAETISGNVDIKNLSGLKSASVSVHSGEITFDGALHPGGRYTFETHSGPITVTLPKDAAFDFECETFSGGIQSDFKASVEMTSKTRHRERDIRGTVNGGGPELTITTFSGPITLKKKD